MSQTTKTQTDPPKTKPDLVAQLTERYGDLVFDLCQSVLWSQPNAQLAFRAVMRDLKRLAIASGRYDRYERAWVLRATCERLRKLVSRYGRSLSASERMMLDGALKGDARLRQMDSYFHRLGTNDQILLLLRDKYKLEYSEISTAMGEPENSLKIRRQQALRALDEMLWDTV